jgi:CRISPR/Cas system-associated exonuclease Cas4 (RecB family)
MERELSWSNSRVDIFTRCRLEYYYNYYGAYGGWTRGADPRARELFILKHTKNRFAWMGDMVHEAIEMFLSAFRSGRRMDRGALVSAADRRMRRQFRASLNQDYRKDPGRHNGLVEHENNIAVPEKAWKDLHANVMTCTENFFYTRFFRECLQKADLKLMHFERLDHFDLEGAKVYAKPDAAIREGRAIQIFDWKTGKQQDEHEFQLHYYILYGMHKLGVTPENIDASLVYLRDNKEKKVEVRPEGLSGAVQYLKETFSAMRACDSAWGEAPDPEAVPGAKSSATCRLCRFRKVCPKKMEEI